jgi:hypothetical protein
MTKEENGDDERRGVQGNDKSENPSNPAHSHPTHKSFRKNSIKLSIN